jgi:hypothetical protein
MPNFEETPLLLEDLRDTSRIYRFTPLSPFPLHRTNARSHISNVRIMFPELQGEGYSAWRKSYGIPLISVSNPR